MTSPISDNTEFDNTGPGNTGKPDHQEPLGLSPADLPADGEVIKPGGFTPLTGTHKKPGFQWKPYHLVLALAVLVLIAVASYIFSATSVIVTAQPATADIDLDGGLSVKLGEGFLILPGEARLSIQAEGYHPLESTLTITGDQNQVFHFELEKLPGHLTVGAPVDEPGEVWIDGEQRGTLNVEITDIPAGEHPLQIVTERYLPWSGTVDITGLDQSQTYPVELEPAWATVTFATQPPGAELSVDQQVLGTTPTAADILRGEREVSLSLPGHKTWHDVLRLEAGESLDLGTIALEKADGLVTVNSRPGGASITVGGDYYGVTPRQIALAPGKSYQITLFKEGFQPGQGRITVESGIEQSVDIDLEAQLGQVTIKATPPDALLYVDGRLLGRADQTLTLPASRTRIEIKKDGYADYSTTVLPRPELAQQIPVTLKTLEQQKWATIKPQITTAAGQTLKLFKPDDTFTMGSSRREQGRRANESLHDVTLTRPFYLGLHEVTNDQYRRFNAEHSSSHIKGNSLDSPDYPAVGINWQQAALYCNWLSQQENLPPFYTVEDGVVTGFDPGSHGYRLPTEAEWAWAARLENGRMLKYAWGPQLPPAENAGNFADRSAAAIAGFIINEYQDGYTATAPVGSFAPNAKGVYDLAGNVAEWINDFYGIATLSLKAEVDPVGPEEGAYHVIRGSSYLHGNVTELRLSYRDYSEDPRNDVGFRIARYVEP